MRSVRKMPHHLLMRADLILQLREVMAWSLTPAQMAEQEKVERGLPHDDHDPAPMLPTWFLHFAAPGKAKGILTILLQSGRDERFSFMDKLTSIRLQPLFEDVD